MHNKYVRLRDLREELGITAKGLDNAIKRKEIEKKYPHEKNIPYLLESDAEIIKHYIINNGRVKAIIEKDKKDIALENEKNKLDEENNRILNELAITVTKLESAEKTIASLN